MDDSLHDATFHQNPSAHQKAPNPPTFQLLLTEDTDVILTALDQQHCSRDSLSSQTTNEDNTYDNSSYDSPIYEPHHPNLIFSTSVPPMSSPPRACQNTVTAHHHLNIPLLPLQTITLPRHALLPTLPLTPAYNTYNFIAPEPKAPEESART